MYINLPLPIQDYFEIPVTVHLKYMKSTQYFTIFVNSSLFQSRGKVTGFYINKPIFIHRTLGIDKKDVSSLEQTFEKLHI